jgi:hypothetical protein
MNSHQTRNNKPTDIYTLNIDDVPCYVGLTTREPSVRLFEHIESASTKRTQKDRVLARALEVGCAITITVIETVAPGEYTDQEETHRARLEDEGFTQGDQFNRLTTREQAALRREIAEWKSKTRKVRNAIKQKIKRATDKRVKQRRAETVIANLKFQRRMTRSVST